MDSKSVTITERASSQLTLPKNAVAGFGEDQFFWAYTEEPHKTRRQAIIKAHPEVISVGSYALSIVNEDIAGHKALRPRAFDQIPCTCSRSSPIDMRNMPAEHANILPAIPPYVVCHWSYSKPEPFPRHT